MRTCGWCLELSVFFLVPFVFYLVSLFLFLMSASASNERSMSNPLCDSSLGSVVTSDYVTPLTLDSDDQANAKLCVQKAAQAADEAWQQTSGGLHGQGITNPTIASLQHPSSASQDEDSDDMDFSAPGKDTLLSKGAWQQVTRIEDLRPAQVSHKWLYHLDSCARSLLTAARLHYQRAKKTRQQSLGRRWPVPMLRFLLGPTVGTRRNLQQRRSHARGTTRAFTPLSEP